MTHATRGSMLIGDLAVDATSSVIFGHGSDLCATSLFVCTPGQFWQRRREAGQAQFRLACLHADRAVRPNTAARAAVAGDCRDLWRSVASHSRTQLQLNRLVFSQVLPSTIGGDAARIWLMVRGGAGWPMASYSVLLGPGGGVTGLAILVVVCRGRLISSTIRLRARPSMIGFGTLGPPTSPVL